MLDDELALHFATLELPPGASLEQVEHAYRVLVKRWHPDHFSQDDEARALALERMKAINAACDVLREHLAWEEAERQRRPAPPPPSAAAVATPRPAPPPRSTPERLRRRQPFVAPQMPRFTMPRLPRLQLLGPFTGQWMVLGVIAGLIWGVTGMDTGAGPSDYDLTTLAGVLRAFWLRAVGWMLAGAAIGALVSGLRAPRR